MPKTPDSNLRAITKFTKEKTVSVNLRLNKNTDADIIEKLARVPSMMGYIKQLIRADIAKNG
ncbi:MAG: hypothetical protein PUC41_09195 [Oscillospiraceae bacterium]|nr:hypothetical protein [Oscillospiraceae bacterium]